MNNREHNKLVQLGGSFNFHLSLFVLFTFPLYSDVRRICPLFL